MSQKEEPTYTIIDVVDQGEVPNWARRPRKWDDLHNHLLKLEPGQSLRVMFPSKKEALRARNTVRDTINLRMGAAAIRTRVVEQEDGKAMGYFTRLFAEDVVEVKRLWENPDEK